MPLSARVSIASLRFLARVAWALKAFCHHGCPVRVKDRLRCSGVASSTASEMSVNISSRLSVRKLVVVSWCSTGPLRWFMSLFVRASRGRARLILSNVKVAQSSFEK